MERWNGIRSQLHYRFAHNRVYPALASAGSIVLIHLFSGIGETRAILKSNLINLLVFLPLAPILTMTYGVPGLIVTLLASNLFYLAYKLAILIRKVGVNLDPKASSRTYLASLLSAIPLLAFLQVWTLHSILNVILGGSLFFLADLTLTPS